MAKNLIINLGSQSRKYALAEGGQILARSHFEAGAGSLEEALQSWQKAGNLAEFAEINKVGIRIVAPGTYFTAHQELTAEYFAKLKLVTTDWPLHLAPVLAELEIVRTLLPQAKLFALSDSAFHQPLPEYSRLLPIDQKLASQHDLYRFGYHGFSLASVVSQLASKSEGLPEKVIVAHLGGGASVTALSHGKTVTTSMSYSPISGLPMSTRSGDLDPAVVLKLLQESKLSPEALLQDLEKKSGLLGLSGESGEVRELLEKEKNGDARAALAIEYFIRSILQYLAGYAAVLGGADLVVLTGTIAERSESVSSRLRVGLNFFLKPEQVIVLLTDEMREMAIVLTKLGDLAKA
ncbi:MAG: hypothetical protein AAB364_00730 [Patescibacteria group bacterium]